MNINQPTVWESIEVECIAKDLNYKEYLLAHNEMNCKGAPVSLGMYVGLMDALYAEMVHDIATLSE